MKEMMKKTECGIRHGHLLKTIATDYVLGRLPRYVDQWNIATELLSSLGIYMNHKISVKESHKLYKQKIKSSVYGRRLL